MNLSNVICNHQRYCHAHCFQRNLRQCHRLVVALRKVANLNCSLRNLEKSLVFLFQIYGEEFPLDGQMDRRKAMLENLSDKKQRASTSLDRRRRVRLMEGNENHCLPDSIFAF